jgi:voltage-dependent potassium channel beta subunit
MPEKMQYRRLGRSGLKVSVLSFGSWVSFGTQMDTGLARDCIAAAGDAGVNFFDNAESYAKGESERIMGAAIAELGWKRETYVVSSKFFMGITPGVNTRETLNRKYLLHAIDGSLERIGLDFLDLVFCHRPDPETPVEETVEAMTDIIESGKAHYWGTSEWSADEIRAAWDVAERHHLRKPVMEQPQYNLFERRRVEKEYARLYEDIGLGLTIWSPLAAGLLTGKYVRGVPKDSRAALPGYEWLREMLVDESRNAQVKALMKIAKRLDVTVSQLAIAWCMTNPNVSTVITGASKPQQVVENMGALDALARITPDVKAEIEKATAKRR